MADINQVFKTLKSISPNNIEWKCQRCSLLSNDLTKPKCSCGGYFFPVAKDKIVKKRDDDKCGPTCTDTVCFC